MYYALAMCYALVWPTK